MIREIPILYSPEMVPAILADRKTMTRRIITPQPIIDEESGSVFDGKHNRQFDIHNWKEPFIDAFAPAMPGDLLWVKEEHYKYGHWIDDEGIFTKSGKQKKKFIATTNDVIYNPLPDPIILRNRKYEQNGWHKRLGRFMFKRDARIWLEVVNIRVEKLHDITEENAISEGVQPNCDGDFKNCPSCSNKGKCAGNGEWFHYMRGFDDFPAYSAIESFLSLWEKINGKTSVEENPWVWVIEFRVLSITGRENKLARSMENF